MLLCRGKGAAQMFIKNSSAGHDFDVFVFYHMKRTQDM